MPVIPNMLAEITPAIGKYQTLIDGFTVTFGANEWANSSLVLPENLHMQSVKVKWWGAEIGDYGFMCATNPSAECSPTSGISSGATTVDLGAYAVYFSPANGCQYIEFWDDTDANLIEIRPVASVTGSVVTLGEATTNAHTTSATCRCILARFAPDRGTENISSGFRMISTGAEVFESENEMTEVLPQGMAVSVRFKAANTGSTRSILVNFRFRRPDQ